MTIKQDRDGLYEAICDECGDTICDGEATFPGCVEAVRDNHGVIAKEGREWAHYCSDCKVAFD